MNYNGQLLNSVKFGNDANMKGIQDYDALNMINNI